MENEQELNLDELDQMETKSDNKLQIKNRFQQLSDKVKLEAQEKEKAQAEAKAKGIETEQAKKQVEFYKIFSQLSAKHPEATNFQEQILERVNKGYDPEEATLAVLAKEGKLSQAQPVAKPVAPEGGSAMTQLADGDKTINDLSREEKLTALKDLEKSGELQQALRRGINIS